jgi:L-lactate dehydrogenase complex protein LldE
MTAVTGGSYLHRHGVDTAAAKHAGELAERLHSGLPLRLALFTTCLVDGLFPETGRSTVQLLERLGHRVEFPLAQTCCGQVHTNTGYFDEVVPLVERYVHTFVGYDAVVVPSGSCTASIRNQHAMVAREAGKAALAEAAERVAGKTFELSQFLIDVLGTDDVGAYFPHRVTYHPTCHSLRLLHVGDRPLRLLRKVKGLELVELPAADECCGFGGTFALKNPEVSTAMLADKMREVLDTGAEVVCAGDRSCLMHIAGGLSRVHSGVRAVHLADILASVETAHEHPRPATTRGYDAAGLPIDREQTR